ncbi:MAG: chain length-determining protein [Betaproteobacteria bacterium]|nr:chain length-determining protein [Betaproteobacteria bacterium]
MNDALDQIGVYLRGIWRSRWIVFVALWAASLGGWVWVYSLANRYEAKARVFVDTQSLLKPLLGGLAVQPNVEQQVLMMTRTLMSRPNLERVARMTDLDLGAKTPQQQDALYKSLTSKISLEGTERENLYTITYRHQSPDIAKRVVQALLTIFTETTLGGARKDLSMSQKFIEEQLKNYETRLREKEQELSEFKRRNMFIMPGQGTDYFQRLAEVGKEIEKAKSELEEATFRKKQLEQQLSEQEETLSAPMVTTTTDSPLDSRISALQGQLDTLRMKYTDRHPEISRTKQLIARLLEEKKQEMDASKARQSKEAVKAQNPVYQQLTVSIAEAGGLVATLKARLGFLDKKRQELLKNVNDIPKVEAEYQELVRDYDVYKANYLDLLGKRETAVISGEMETKTDVVDFRVVEPPRVSNLPVWPNRPLLISAVPFGGLALGIGLAVLLIMLRPSIESKKQMRDLTDIPILGVVTKVKSDSERRKQRIHNLIYLAGLGALATLYAAQMIFYITTSPTG